MIFLLNYYQKLNEIPLMQDSFYFKVNSRNRNIFLIIGSIGLIISFIGAFLKPDLFYSSYLVSFVFWLSIALGSLFLLVLHYLTGAVWSVVLRRLFEHLASVIPLFLILFIPVIFGIHHLFEWSHTEIVKNDALLTHKSAFLNTPFFIIRSLVYFVIWSFTALFFFKLSLKQDQTGDSSILTTLRRTSPPAIILFALTLTFASFDWLMSLEAHWYSTIFGVYIFSGATVGALAGMIILVLFLHKNNMLKNTITVEHYHDLGKLLFTFTVFWAYMAFSQYFLIWYANIPEETIWYQHRWTGSWKIISLLLVFGHFVVPFFTLLIRAMKRSAGFILFISLWMLFMHWIDIYWIIMPTSSHHGFHLTLFDLSCFIGIGGLSIWFILSQIGKYPLVPIKDPNLEKSILKKN